jgi:hypothetical protein
MEASAQSMGLQSGYEGLSVNRAVLRENDLSRKGQAALDLIDQIADTISVTENRLEALLLQALDQLKAAEDQNGVLTVRATEAEGRASEAVKWLRRLHDEVEVKLAAQIQGSGNWATKPGPLEPSARQPIELHQHRVVDIAAERTRQS